MQFDTLLLADITEAAATARRLAAAGIDGVFTFEGPQEPFLPLALAAEATDLTVYPNVALAFPRSPMTTAYEAWSLQKLSGGRFLLGLGTQVRANVVRRYSAEWRAPVERMREFVEATRAVFRCWQDGERLEFQGDHYTLTLMQPTFAPGPLECGPPPILVGALGPRMTRMVGEVADGILVHPFHTPRFLHERLLPELDAGLVASGRGRGPSAVAGPRSTDHPFRVVCDVIVAAGRDEAELATAVDGVRGLCAFYASTPAYRAPLEPYGWEGIQPELNRLTKEGRWDELAGLVDDELVRTVAVVGTPAEVADQIVDRFGGLADRVGFYLPYAAPADLLPDIVTALHTRP